MDEKEVNRGYDMKKLEYYTKDQTMYFVAICTMSKIISLLMSLSMD